MKLRILLADDHRIIVDGLRQLINNEPDMEVAGAAEDGHGAVRLARELEPDVVILDISMPGLNGIEAADLILAERPKSRVIALSVHSDRRFVSRILQAGASGYLLKNCASKELVEAIRIVAGGETYVSPKVAGVLVKDYLGKLDKPGVLSQREREVLQLIAEGQSTKQIGVILFISPKTVERHRKQIMEKLNLYNVADLVKYAIKEGITGL
jgi:DNA-binding NarL/FixJ family response regulator